MSKKKFLKILPAHTGWFAFVGFLTPIFALAQATNVQPLITFVTDVQTLVQYVIPVAVALAVLFFFWGLAQYVLAAEDAQKRADGRSKMIWGVIALFVIVSIWGIIGFIGGILGIGQGGTSAVPGVVQTAGGGGTNPGIGGTGGGGGGGGGGGPTTPPPPPAGT